MTFGSFGILPDTGTARMLILTIRKAMDVAF